jgi:dihydrofolate reductase
MNCCLADAATRTCWLPGMPRVARIKTRSRGAPKYVASSSSATRLSTWPNSTLVHGDIHVAVAELKRNSGGNLVITGSGQWIRSLLPHSLIDEYLWMINPLVLGSGQRLFEHDDHVAKLQLIGSTATTTGMILATYQPILKPIPPAVSNRTSPHASIPVAR